MQDEGLGIIVVVIDVVVDGILQFPGGAMNAAAELLFCQYTKPAFHQVKPTGRGGCEVEVKPWLLGCPVTDQLRLVRAVVIQDQVNIQISRNVLFDGVQKLAKLHRAMTALRLADRVAGLGVERGEHAGTQRYAGSRPFDIPSQRIVGESFSLSGTRFPAIDGGKDLLHAPLFVQIFERGQAKGVEE